MAERITISIPNGSSVSSLPLIDSFATPAIANNMASQVIQEAFSRKKTNISRVTNIGYVK